MPAPTSSRRDWLLLVAPCLLLLLLAGWRPLAVPDEGRYGDVSRWMLVSGDWLIPRLDGLPFFHKPPLTHWFQAASMGLLGVSPWAVRVPGVLLASLMVAATHVAVRQMAGVTLAQRAAWMLGTGGGFLAGGQYVNHDMGVAAWIACSVWCFALALWRGERPHAGWARAGFAACALGLLTKGLIGVVLPALVIGAWIAWTRRWRLLARLPWVTGLALFGAIALPWFWLAGERYPGLWRYLFGVQQFARYTSNHFNNPQPWWFYLAACLLLMFPWAFWAIGEGWARLREVIRRGGETHATDAHAHPHALATLCWIWLGAILLFFSVPRSKLIGYALPLLPPLAVLAALGWERWMVQRRPQRIWFAVSTMVAVALPVTLTVMAPRVDPGDRADDVATVLACRAASSDEIYVVGGYPQDLAFMAQTQKPLRVVQDWARRRSATEDNWARELLDAGAFEPAAATRVLLTPAQLAPARHQPDAWLLAPTELEDDDARALVEGWRLVHRGRAWTLYHSPVAVASTPEQTLPGCTSRSKTPRNR